MIPGQKQYRAYTPTAEIIWRYENTPNPVTRSVYRDMIGDRIDQGMFNERRARR